MCASDRALGNCVLRNNESPAPGLRPDTGERVARTEPGIAEAATARTAAQAPAPVIGLRRSFPARDGGLASSGTCRLGCKSGSGGKLDLVEVEPAEGGVRVGVLEDVHVPRRR